MLGDLIKRQPTVIEAEYPDAPGFIVTLRYVGATELERVIGDKKVVIKGSKVKNLGGFNDAVRQTAARAIIGWRGLNKEALLALNLDLDVDKVAGLPDDFELDCTQEHKDLLLKHDAVFMRWIHETATDISEMREQEVAEQAKNSPTSQPGTAGEE